MAARSGRAKKGGSKKGSSKGGASMGDRHGRRFIEEVIVKYHLQTDLTKTYMQVITHQGSGGFVDAIVFENGDPNQGEVPLIERLGIKDSQGNWAPVDVAKNGDKDHVPWIVKTFSHGGGQRPNHCVWIHDDLCTWSENCD